MRQHHAATAFTFDAHFREQSFEVLRTLLLRRRDIGQRQVPVCQQDLEAPLLFALVSGLVGPELLISRSSSGFEVVPTVEFLNR